YATPEARLRSGCEFLRATTASGIAVRPEQRPSAVAAEPAAAPAHGEPHEADDRFAGGALDQPRLAGADHQGGDRSRRLEGGGAAARQARTGAIAAVRAAVALRQRRGGGACPT